MRFGTLHIAEDALHRRSMSDLSIFHEAGDIPNCKSNVWSSRGHEVHERTNRFAKCRIDFGRRVT